MNFFSVENNNTLISAAFNGVICGLLSHQTGGCPKAGAIYGCALSIIHDNIKDSLHLNYDLPTHKKLKQSLLFTITTQVTADFFGRLLVEHTHGTKLSHIDSFQLLAGCMTAQAIIQASVIGLVALMGGKVNYTLMWDKHTPAGSIIIE